MTSSGADRWFDGLKASLRDIERRTQAGPSLDRYELLGPLGEGAASKVFRARDRQLGRIVALKILREALSSSDSVVERFQREAKVTAGLSHPNLVSIHDAGVDDGKAYLVMELVEGRPLAERLRARGDPLPALARILEKAARGVAAAQERGVVHRDLKPGNILVSPEGEPKVCDFGLAYVAGSEAGLTRTGTVLGTPLYMAPEQVKGNSRSIGAPTDVYALGAILYEMITGRPPHSGETVTEIYGKILYDEPTAPRKLNPAAPADLVTIAAKALEKDPSLRYATAGEFADDLKRHLDGEPILARPPGPVRLLKRFLKRHGTPVGIVAALLLATGGWLVADRISRQGRATRAVESGRRLETEDRLAEARDAYRAALEAVPGHPDAAAGAVRTGLELDRRREEDRKADAILEEIRPEIFRVLADRYRDDVAPAEILRRAEAVAAPAAEAVRLAPRKAAARHQLGIARDLLGDWEGAETAWREALRLDPDLGQARFHLGKLLLTRSLVSTSGATKLEREQGLARAHGLAQEASLELERAAGRLVSPEEELQRAVARAMIAYVSNDGQALGQAANQGMATYGRRPGAEEFYLLSALNSQKETRLSLLDAAISICPHHALARFIRGSHLMGLGQGEDAITAYTEAIERNPRLHIAWLNRGVVRGELGQIDEALKDLDVAVGLAPSAASAHLARAEQLAHARRFEEALSDLDQALRQDPGNPRGRGLRAEILYRLKDFDRALAAYDDVLRDHPGLESARMGRALILFYERRDFRRVEADTTEVLSRNPDHYNALFLRARARKRIAEPEKALEDLRRALALAPADWEFRKTAEKLERQWKAKDPGDE